MFYFNSLNTDLTVAYETGCVVWPTLWAQKLYAIVDCPLRDIVWLKLFTPALWLIGVAYNAF